MSKTSERRKRIPFFVILIVILTVAGCVAFYFFGSGSGVSGNSPVINEVLCSNSASFKAYDGRFYDWIELYNPTSSEMPLDGYYLSDDAESLTKNPLSGQTIPAKGYLVIYCSGLNLTDERGFLHTPFVTDRANLVKCRDYDCEKAYRGKIDQKPFHSVLQG